MAKQIKKYSKIALIVGLSIALMTIHLMTPSAEGAGVMTNRELRISDSRLGATNVYYDFLADDVGGAVSCIQIKFCDETDIDTGTCTAPDNMDTQMASTTATTTVFDWNNMNSDGVSWELYSTTSNTLVASTSASVASEDWGDDGSLVISGITNSNATQTYFAWIQTYSGTDCGSLSGEVDRGVLAFAILSGVTVTATVAESLSVTVNASTCESLISGGLNATSTTTTIPYGTVLTEDFYNSCQRLDIGTNGASGYIARIHKTQQLTSAGSDVIGDGDCDATCGTSTEGTWSNDNNNGFAYCMKDESSNAAATADNGWSTLYCGAGSQSFKTISNGASSSEAIMQASSATSSNNAWVGYRLSVDAAQPAGTYTTIIVYTVTPKY